MEAMLLIDDVIALLIESLDLLEGRAFEGLSGLAMGYKKEI